MPIVYDNSPRGRVVYDEPDPYDEVVARAQSEERLRGMTPEQVIREVTPEVLPPEPETEAPIFVPGVGWVSAKPSTVTALAPLASRVAPPLAAGLALTGVGVPAAMAVMGGATLAGELGAQALEKELGVRESFSPTEAGAAGIVGSIPGLTQLRAIRPAMQASRTLRAAVPLAEGAGYGALYPTVEAGLRGELPEGEAVRETARFGTMFGVPFAVAGALTGGRVRAPGAGRSLEPLPAGFEGVPLPELPVLPPNPEAALARQGGLARQIQLEDALRAQPPRSAEESAAVFSQFPEASDVAPAELAAMASAARQAEAERIGRAMMEVGGSQPGLGSVVGEPLPFVPPLSPVEQRMINQQGRVSTSALAPAGGAAVGAAGGYMAGDTPEEKAALSLAGAAAGATGGAALNKLPKSTRTLVEPQVKPPSIANAATEIATQTKGSPGALQARLNEMTAVPAPPPAQAATPAAIAALDAAGFRAWAQAQPEGLTGTALEHGRAAAQDAKMLAELKAGKEAVDAEVRAAMEAYKTLPQEAKMGALNEMTSLTSKAQYFNEALAEAGQAAPSGGEITLYHGGPKLEGDIRDPAFLTTDRGGAEWFAGERGRGTGEVAQFSATLKNPLDIDGPDGIETLIRIAKESGADVQITGKIGVPGWDFYSPDIAKHSPYDGGQVVDLVYIPSVRKALREAGYDSIKLDDQLERGTIPTYVVLDRSLLKKSQPPSPDAIPIQEPDAGVPRPEAPQPEIDMGLQRVGEGDAQPGPAAGDRARETPSEGPVARTEVEQIIADAPGSTPPMGRPAEVTRQAARMRSTRGAALIPGTPQTETPAFKRWFGESKVVDAKGKPLVVYKAMYPYDWRGAGLEEITSINRPSEFPAFNKGEKGVKVAGFFGDIPTANRFAESAGSGQAIYPTYLSLKKPFVIEAGGRFAGDVQFGESGKVFRDAIRSGKYDGVIIRNTKDEGTIYVALDPTQIKSATGNRGTFDPSNPDIRGAVSPRVLTSAGGSTIGAGAGYFRTQQGPDETDEEFQARRLRNTLLGAGAGAAIGFGTGTLAQGAKRRMAMEEAAKAAEEAAAKARKTAAGDGPAVPLPPVGRGQEVRETAKKVIENKGYTQRVRETLANDPDIIYDVFSRNEVRDQMVSASWQELESLGRSNDKRVRAGALAEMANRLSVTPGKEGEAAALISELSQMFTEPAQLIGMGSLIRTPEIYVKATEAQLAKVNRKLPEAEAKKLRDLAADKIRAERDLEAQNKLTEQEFSPENVKKKEQAEARFGTSSKAVADYISDIVPDDWSDIMSKILQGNLLTPLSLARNVFGNTAFQPIRKGAYSIATALDAVYSALSGRPRVLAQSNPLPGIRETAAWADGTALAAKELLTGPSADSYAKAEVQRGFRPMRALVQAWTGEGLPVRESGVVAINDRLKKVVEGTLGIPAEVMFRALNLGDKGVREAEAIRLLLEEARLRNLKGAELEKFIMFPDKATTQRLMTEGREATFTQENQGAKIIRNTLDNLASFLPEDMANNAFIRGALKVVARTQVPFVQFPLNYLTTALNFAAPELAMFRAWNNAAQGKRREAMVAMGQAAMGGMMYSAAAWLWDKGIISEPVAKDARGRSIQFDQMGPQRINISALQRAAAGEDTAWRSGDETRDWGSLGIPAFVFHTFTQNAAKLQKEAARTGEPVKPNDLTDTLMTFPYLAEHAFDQSFLAGTSAFLDAVKDWDRFGEAWLQNTFRSVTSIPLPNTIESMNRTQFKYIPEMKGKTPLETAENILRYKSMTLDPGAPTTVYKRDLWGQKIPTTPEGANPYAYHLFDPTRKAAKTMDATDEKLYRLFDSTDSPDIYPSIPAKSITFQGTRKELPAKDYEALQVLSGAYAKRAADAVVNLPAFNRPDVPDELKIQALDAAYREASSAATQQFLRLPGVMERIFPEMAGGKPTEETPKTISRSPEARMRYRMGAEAPVDAPPLPARAGPRQEEPVLFMPPR